MKDAFLSYVEEDGDVAGMIARELEACGCSVWHYQRDAIPGLSYLSQTRRAIDEARCFLFLISATSIERHYQVDKELVHAHEVGKPIIPLLRDIRFRSFQQARPEWDQAIGAVVGVELSVDTTKAVIPRLMQGLRSLGIAVDSAASQPPPVSTAESFTVEDIDAGANDEGGFESAAFENCFEVGNADTVTAKDYLPATIVHEHPKTGFLADVVVTEIDSSDTLRIGFSHVLLKADPHVVEFQPGKSSDALQYFRFPDLIHGYPVVLRLHWLTRLPKWSTFVQTFGVTTAPAVRIRNTAQDVFNEDAVGMLVKGKFKLMIEPGQQLPNTQRKSLRTRHDSQNSISVIPAVRRADGEVQIFPKLKITVPPAPAGVAWLEFVFHIDPDGRFTVSARDPLHALKIRDLIIVQ